MFSLAKHGKSFITTGPDQVRTKLFGTVIVFRKDFILKKVNFEFKKQQKIKQTAGDKMHSNYTGCKYLIIECFSCLTELRTSTVTYYWAPVQNPGSKFVLVFLILAL